ncbi:MAG: hypothetical protein Q8M98_05205 [Candidatus Cloacimonadaceae bacterium]|nr:hypothetical protein [Candidatus Cloacimonadaceae bacterium]
MPIKNFDKVYYRTAATPITTIAFSGATPSGWTALPAAALIDTAKIDLDKDVVTELNDGSSFIGSEKGTAEVSLINFAATDYGTIRSALINNLVDLILIDSDNKSPAYCLWASRLYPKFSAGDGEPKITLSADKKRSAGATSAAVTIIPVT